MSLIMNIFERINSSVLRNDQSLLVEQQNCAAGGNANTCEFMDYFGPPYLLKLTMAVSPWRWFCVAGCSFDFLMCDDR